MTSSDLDIVAIGDAIVDVIATCDDDFLAAHRLPKGSIQLLNPAQADELYAAMGPAREISGGSAANSMAGAAALGLNAAFTTTKKEGTGVGLSLARQVVLAHRGAISVGEREGGGALFRIVI